MGPEALKLVQNAGASPSPSLPAHLQYTKSRVRGLDRRACLAAATATPETRRIMRRDPPQMIVCEGVAEGNLQSW